MIKTIFAVICGLLFAAHVAQAQDQLRKEIARCSAIAGDLDRLSCFDEIAKKDGLDRPQSLPVQTSGTGKWRTVRDKNPIDDSERVVLLLTADSGTGRLREPVTFVARCQSNTTEAYINWQIFVGDDSHSVYSDWKYVTIRIGSASAERQRWGISTSKDATFAPRWAGDLLKRMARADRFIAQTTPYGESPITATFDTTGLSNALKPLATACNWSID